MIKGNTLTHTVTVTILTSTLRFICESKLKIKIFILGYDIMYNEIEIMLNYAGDQYRLATLDPSQISSSSAKRYTSIYFLVDSLIDLYIGIINFC